MLSIAVVEDNDDLRAAILNALRGEGHHVVGFDCAEALAEQGRTLRIDLVVVDLNLPGEDGISLARRLRATEPEIGIIMMTARTRTDDKRIGYESGADIYLAKPVSLEELAAAILALSRRLRPAPAAPTGLVVDTGRLTLGGPSGVTHLSASEAALLAAFARAQDHRLETWQIIEVLEQVDRALNRNALNVTVSRLSTKLRQSGTAPRPIRAIRNWGYQLCEPVRLT
ncbi:response regulator transcription factor [Ancylobacter dichloromethanicus]|uniref:DNA-binding response regulator n=1 Tax=Ancylobacter dichloromethanicus TaxID=518825 RepID=A0A9W6JDB5_9HYPH|nr:response regulator transcription factor [Ancylobacter dichloromethanicus]MBS7556657.1 response regulator transcription factor [Ancylobacter dichloromethanicus]GLK73508.1 DNA-binding response regulator [Ancylobacter dichloromethanicus]